MAKYLVLRIDGRSLVVDKELRVVKTGLAPDHQFGDDLELVAGTLAKFPSRMEGRLILVLESPFRIFDFDELFLVFSRHYEIDREPATLSFMHIPDPASLLVDIEHIPIIELEVIQEVPFEPTFVPNDLVENEAWELPDELPDTASVCDFSKAHGIWWN